MSFYHVVVEALNLSPEEVDKFQDYSNGIFVSTQEML